MLYAAAVVVSIADPGYARSNPIDEGEMYPPKGECHLDRIKPMVMLLIIIHSQSIGSLFIKARRSGEMQIKYIIVRQRRTHCQGRQRETLFMPPPRHLKCLPWR